MKDPGIELDEIRTWRNNIQLFARWSNRKRLLRMIDNSKRKTRSFCKRHSGFYTCKNCKGSGIDTGIQSLNADFKGYTDVYLCEVCNGLGIETWLDKMTRGWKNV